MTKVHTIEPQPLLWWFKNRHDIDMDPPYQRRGRLWKPKDKALLIDSIVNRLDIPKFYLADFTFKNTPLNIRNTPYAVIDGKQRFEAITDFFENRLRLAHDFVYFPDRSVEIAGMSYSDIKEVYPLIAEEIENFQITVMGVISDDERGIREMFVRLNRNVNLSGAEKRNAMQGPIPALVREIAKHEFFHKKINFGVTRGQDWDTTAKFLLLEDKSALTTLKKSNLDRLAKDYEHLDLTNASIQDLKSKVTAVLNFSLQVFEDKDYLLERQSHLPLYYWFLKLNPDKEPRRIRQFLVHFEQQRRRNKRQINQRAAGQVVVYMDDEMTEYNNLNRTPDDKLSLEGRMRILQQRFTEWYSPRD